jgi:glycolate oxidase
MRHKPDSTLDTKVRVALDRAVGAENVLVDDEAMLPYTHDEAPFPIVERPIAVVRPLTVDAAVRAFAVLVESRLPITPRGAGSGKAGGAVAAPGGVVFSLERLTRILDIDEKNGVARIEAGVITAELQREVEARGLFYPPDPASLAYSTLGGNIATNAGGPRALKYGVTRDFVLGLDVLLPTGERVRLGRQTTKGVAGYDLTALIVGSEGTLGVVLDATLKLLPLPLGRATAIFTFSSAEAAARTVSRLFSTGVLPVTIEYLDRKSIDAVRAFGAPYSFSAHAAAALLVETDGLDDDMALVALERAANAAVHEGAIDTEVATDVRRRRDLWETRRRLSEATKRITGRKFSEDITVPRGELPSMVATIDALGERHDLQTCAFGHAGDGNLHVQILFDTDADLPRVHALLDELFHATIALRGTISGEHGIGRAKKRWLPLEQGSEVLALERRVRRAFDPHAIMNPGAIFDDE